MAKNNNISRKTVLSYLNECFNNDPTKFISKIEIRNVLKTDQKTIDKILAYLCQSNYISRENKKYQINANGIDYLDKESKHHDEQVPVLQIYNICAVVFGGITLVFFMGLVVFSTLGFHVPDNSRFLVVVVLALGSGLSVNFLGGSFAAKGNIPLPFAKEHPVKFAATGGGAITVIVLILGNLLYS